MSTWRDLPIVLRDRIQLQKVIVNLAIKNGMDVHNTLRPSCMMQAPRGARSAMYSPRLSGTFVMSPRQIRTVTLTPN